MKSDIAKAVQDNVFEFQTILQDLKDQKAVVSVSHASEPTTNLILAHKAKKARGQEVGQGAPKRAFALEKKS